MPSMLTRIFEVMETPRKVMNKRICFTFAFFINDCDSDGTYNSLTDSRYPQ